MTPNLLYANYEKAGIYFSKRVITNYALSLYTKPYVILSGISGTGKTKIAQLFQPYNPERSETYDTKKKHLSDVGTSYITLTLTEGILKGDGRGNIRKEDLELLLSEDEFTEYNRERNALLQKGTADNFSKIYSINIILEENQAYGIQFYIQRAKSPLIRVRFKSKRGDKNQYNLQPILNKMYKIGDVINLVKVDEKTFKIVKSNDNDVIEYESINRVRTYDENICLIPVKSDWTDSSGVLGYYNIIEQKYHMTPFLKHLLYANENPDVPFFVIFDEMNLSKIEYYLSDVLSILETRIAGENGIVMSEKLTLYSATSADGYIDTDDEYFDTIPAKLSIPINFYITGTMNIDETTYIPSPKVLDRANVIEFNEVSLESYFNNTETVDDSNFVLKEIPNYAELMLPSQQISNSLPKEIQKAIIEINEILKKYNLHFGYRVASEMSLYIINATKYISYDLEILYEALDIQIVQKILPKIIGTPAKIEKALLEVYSYLTREELDINYINLDTILEVNVEESRFPRATQKIRNIFIKLNTYGFASGLE